MSVTMTVSRMVVVAAVVFTAGTSWAQDSERPATGTLVLAGVGMAIPTYFVGVAVHEGSHALAARLVGAEVIGLQVLPGRHPRNKRFYFGYTEIRGRLSKGQNLFFLAAPKLVDLAMLGGYSALIGFDAVPDNRYGRLALAVVATGFWVDFAKDIPPFAEHHDMPRIYTMLGHRSEASRLPLRLVHAAMAVGFAYVLYRGYDGVFEDGESGPMNDAANGAALRGRSPAAPPREIFILPLTSGRF